MNVFIAGNFSEEHIGAHFLNAARQLNLNVWSLDYSQSISSVSLINKVYWRLDRRPARLEHYANSAIELCKVHKIDALIATGMAPFTSSHLKTLKSLNVRTACFLTDNPWNPALTSKWQLESLPAYHAVFNPRCHLEAKLKDLNPKTYPLCFAYSPDYHFPEESSHPISNESTSFDLLFIGGADDDRAEVLRHVLPLKLNLGLFGGYWDKYPDLKIYSHGFVHGSELRCLIQHAKINLCLVRRANQDGHVMRTFEIPAIGGCMLTEYTTQHEHILGIEGDTACYFHNPNELIEKLNLLMVSPRLRSSLAQNAHRRIISGRNSYADRLQLMLDRLFDS